MAVGIATPHQEELTMTAMTNTINTGAIMSSPKRLARIAGLFYLLVAIFGGFSEGFLDGTMHVAGNAAATAANVVANAGLVRLGVAAHLLDGIFFISTALVLYILLQHVHKSVARAMLVFVALAVGIKCLNAIFLFEGLQVARDSSYAAALGTAGSHALVLMLLDIQHYGTLSAQVFFGLWLAPLGYLAIKSGLFPKALGVALIAAAVSYLVHLFAALLVPDVGNMIKSFVVFPVVSIAEVWIVLYLLVKGVRDPAQGTPTGRAGDPSLVLGAESA